METRIAASELFPSLHQIKAPSFSFYHSQQSFRFAHPLSHSNHQYVLCSASRCLRHCRLGRSRCAHWRSRDVPFPQTRTQPPRLLAQVRRQAHEDLRRLLRLLQLLLRRAGHVGAERRRLPLRRHQRRQVLDGPGKPPLPHDHYSKKKNTHIGIHQFYVSSAPHQAAWTKLEGGGVDCGVTSECSTAQERGTEACTSTTFSTSASVDFSIVKDVLGASASVGAEWTDSTCNSSGLTNSCTWDDQKCHALWASESQTLIKGYIRRRCNFHGDDAGDVTVWSTDYDIYVPTGNSVAGCAALCSDTSYPGSLP